MSFLPQWVTLFVERIAAEDTFRYVRRYLHPHDAILDVGSGTGIVAALLRHANRQIECLDIEDIHSIGPPPRLYPGVTFPYPDNSFPFVLCAFVLHHATQQEVLVQEMRRVSSANVCVLEDIPATPADKVLLFLHYWYSRLRYRHPTTKFRSVAEWTQLFQQHGLRVQETLFLSRKRQLWNPVTRALFLLVKA